MPSDEKPGPNLVALRDAREQAIAQLSDAFAHDLIEVEEFERRVTLAHRSDSVTDVERTVSDLVAPSPSVITVSATAARPLLGSEQETDKVLAIFSGVERRGTWTLPRHLQAFAILGGIVLDFREALLLPGVTELQIVAVMGGVELIVPPGLSVEVSGTAIMGGFGHVERVPTQLDPDRPVLRVRGLAMMGGVAVETRLPGESEREAHRRRGRDRRALGDRPEPKRLPEKSGR
jgi:hypothetical protein